MTAGEGPDAGLEEVDFLQVRGLLSSQEAIGRSLSLLSAPGVS